MSEQERLRVAATENQVSVVDLDLSHFYVSAGITLGRRHVEGPREAMAELAERFETMAGDGGWSTYEGTPLGRSMLGFAKKLRTALKTGGAA